MPQRRDPASSTVSSASAPERLRPTGLNHHCKKRYNNLVTLTLSGAEIVQALEQQWLHQPRPRILQVSRGFAYAWDGRRPVGQRVVPGSVTLDGRPLEPTAEVRVTVNSFLAAGGDNFAVFKAGRAARTGAMDIDALEAQVGRGGSAGAMRDASEARIRRLD